MSKTRMRGRYLLALVPVLMCGMARAQDPAGPPIIYQEERHDISPPLRNLPELPPQAVAARQIPLRLVHPPKVMVPQADPVVQTAPTSTLATSSGLSFEGLGSTQYGFTVNAVPPDTNGAVGATQYVQWVNESFAVFDKTTGALLLGPVAGNSLWSGFGGPCETTNDGDPIAQYDKLANRWVMTQFANAFSKNGPYYQCVAVSQTSDATGAYYRYAWSFSQFNDYPKLGVWPDAYYITFNMFQGNRFQGAQVCALNRNAMLNGNAATAACFMAPAQYGALLPADLDGTNPPPLGSPNYLLNFDGNLSSLDLWKFHVDFATPGNSTFTGPTNIPVASFNEACGGGACIPQPGTSQLLDSLADRLMYRLAYRNLPDHEVLVVNHSVTAGNSVGVRWYELRNPNGTPDRYQQGTWAPDSSYRWMGSVAMDSAGDIALGYSAASSSLYPSIRYTGRVPSDPLGTMQSENSVMTGSGSQTTYTRWGDYSSMSVDPVDDCTFWYTTEYLTATGVFNWHTRIASFRFPGCSTIAVMLSPTPGSTLSGSSVTFSWTTGTGTNGYQLYVGTSPGAYDVYYGPLQYTTSATVAGLYASGTLYVRLWSRMASSWQYNDYTYTGP